MGRNLVGNLFYKNSVWYLINYFVRSYIVIAGAKRPVSSRSKSYWNFYVLARFYVSGCAMHFSQFNVRIGSKTEWNWLWELTPKFPGNFFNSENFWSFLFKGLRIKFLLEILEVFGTSCRLFVNQFRLLGPSVGITSNCAE